PKRLRVVRGRPWPRRGADGPPRRGMRPPASPPDPGLAAPLAGALAGCSPCATTCSRSRPAARSGPPGDRARAASFGGAGGEMLGVGGAGELLADQPGQLNERGPGPVVGHDVLRLPGGVTGDQDGVADLGYAADLGDVVLEEAVFAVRTGEVDGLGEVERADRGHDVP